MFDTVDTIQKSLDIMAGMLASMTVNSQRMLASTQQDFSNATELADYLAKKGLPFREAHEVVGKLVLECSKSDIYLQDIPLERYQEVSVLIEPDIYQALESHIAVQRRNSLGGTGFEQIRLELARARQELQS